MNKIEVNILQIMADVLEKPVAELNTESTQDNIDTWDSIKHLNLVVAIEEEFDIVIPIEEVGHLVSFKLIEVIVKEQLENEGKTY